MPRVSHQTWFDATPESLFEFHLDATNLVRISPPFPRMAIDAPPPPSREGDEHILHLMLGPFRVQWVGIISRLRRPSPGRPGYTEDRMTSGPFRSWRHQHQFHHMNDGAALRDVIAFRFFPTRFGAVFDWLFVAPGIKAMLVWRHRRTRQLLREEPIGG